MAFWNRFWRNRNKEGRLEQEPRKIYKAGRLSQNPPPNKPGQYRMRNKETKEVEYIGESSNLMRRIKEHHREGTFSPGKESFEWKEADIRSTSETRRKHERRQIDKHSPKRNQRRGGGGRIAKRQTE